MAQEFTIPYGTAKGTPIISAELRDLTFTIEALDRSIADPTKVQYKARNQTLFTACRAEVARRASGGAPASAPTSAAAPANREETTKAIQAYSGAHDDAKTATEALAKLQEVGHLVSPAPACGTLPEGTSIVISAVMVNEATDTYQVQNGRGLAKVALNKIGGALGVSWSPSESGRLDDGKDPRYMHYRAVGYIREFDGSPRRIVGEKIIDLRVGSAQCEALQKRSEDKAKRDGSKVGDWEAQIRDIRLFILEHAETKAQLRAVRSLGIRSNYTSEELKKPFFGARLQFTGRSEDPAIRRMFAEKIADNMLSATKQLYGAPASEPQVTPVSTAGYAAPPIDVTGHAVDEDDPLGPDGVPAATGTDDGF